MGFKYLTILFGGLIFSGALNASTGIEQSVSGFERILSENALGQAIGLCEAPAFQQPSRCSRVVSDVRANLKGRWYDWPARKLGVAAPYEACGLNSTTPAFWSPLHNEQELFRSISTSHALGPSGIKFDEMACAAEDAPIGERMALSAITPMLAARLQVTLEGLLGEYLAASSLLGDGNDILSEESVCVGTSPAMESFCSQWRNCREAGGLEEAAKRLHQHWPAYHAVVQQRKKVALQSCGRPARPGCVEKRAQEVERLDRIIQLYQQMFPLLASDKVQKLHRRSTTPSEQEFAQAMKHDVRERQKDLKKRIHELAPALSCLSDPLRRANCELDFELIRQKTSP